MPLSLFCLFLILLQNTVTEQAAEPTMEPTTDNTSSISENSETTPTTEPTADTTTYEASTNAKNTPTFPTIEPTAEGTTEDSTSNTRNTQTIPSTDPTIEGTTEDSITNSRNSQTNRSTEPTVEGTTEDSNTNSYASTKSTDLNLPMIRTRSLPTDVSDEPENLESNEQKHNSYEKNHSKLNIFGIVLASILGTIAVFYIAVSLVTKYRRKSYIVRSPGIELGQA